MKRRQFLSIVGALSMMWLLAGCTALGGAAVGGAGAATAYEYQHKQALEELEQDLEQGRITREEYLERKEAISERSLVY
jgi:hypothetical protein